MCILQCFVVSSRVGRKILEYVTAISTRSVFRTLHISCACFCFEFTKMMDVSFAVKFVYKAYILYGDW